MGAVGADKAWPTPLVLHSPRRGWGETKALLAAGRARWIHRRSKEESNPIKTTTKYKNQTPMHLVVIFFSVFEMKRSRAVYKLANSYSKRDLVLGSSFPCRTRDRMPDWTSRSIPKCHAEALVVLLHQSYVRDHSRVRYDAHSVFPSSKWAFGQSDRAISILGIRVNCIIINHTRRNTLLYRVSSV